MKGSRPGDEDGGGEKLGLGGGRSVINSPWRGMSLIMNIHQEPEPAVI